MVENEHFTAHINSVMTNKLVRSRALCSNRVWLYFINPSPHTKYLLAKDSVIRRYKMSWWFKHYLTNHTFSISISRNVTCSHCKEWSSSFFHSYISHSYKKQVVHMCIIIRKKMKTFIFVTFIHEDYNIYFFDLQFKAVMTSLVKCVSRLWTSLTNLVKIRKLGLV